MSLVRFKAQNHPQQQAKDEIDDRATTPEMFAELHARFGFTVDVAAAEHNAKLPRYYTREQDGMAQSWGDESVYCNPPYSNIRPWVEKAWSEWLDGLIAPRRIVMLLPANRTEQGWWQELVEPYLRARRSDFTCEFLSGRIRFILRGKTEVGMNERPPFGSCLLIWEEQVMVA